MSKYTAWQNSNASFKAQLIWLTPYARIFLRLLASCLAFSSPSPMTCVPFQTSLSHSAVPHCF